MSPFSRPAPLETSAQPQMDALARSRLTVYCIVLLVLGSIDAGRFIFSDFTTLVAPASSAETADIAAANVNALRGWAHLGGLAAALLVIVYFLVIQRQRLATYKQVIDNVSLLIVLVGALLLAARLVFLPALPAINADKTVWVLLGIVDLAVLHLAACMIMPWSARESAIPFIPLLLVWTMVVLIPDVGEWEIFDRVVVVIMSPIVLAPGAMITSWRRKRSLEDMERLRLGEQVRSIGGELSRARIVHDAMFPRPYDNGHVCFEYEYVPIHEIGGDYVHFHADENTGCTYLTLLDVAGHGLAAALTVNRLFGELERIRAENPDATPAGVMSLLNRYINLTMARHNLYATGACFMLDSRSGQLHWVNAGHPPSLLRRPDGRVFDMKGTAMLLGAQSYAEFEPNQQTIGLSPGDVVIAYTDGAYEARNAAGERFGIARMRQTALFNPPPRSWTRFITTAVSKHHAGCADDDVLIATLTLRSLRVTGVDSSSRANGERSAAGDRTHDVETVAAESASVT